nr:MAG TPA: hypothetical protein [Bacteriophage sp.]DAX08027.1 MAG TPA: hypothetical protein [Bacteriophage sp.]
MLGSYPKGSVRVRVTLLFHFSSLVDETKTERWFLQSQEKRN